MLVAALVLQQCLINSMIMVNALPARNDSSVDIILWPAQSLATVDGSGFGAADSGIQMSPLEEIGDAVRRSISYAGSLWDTGMKLGLELARRVFTGFQVG
uniref:Putative secreted salivary peptide of the 6.2 kDa family n=1 Tax=Ochlerotatus triseriatus TaxID=7162 RepID=C6ZQW0_OCHTR